MARKDELGRLLAREEGKTLAEAVGRPSVPRRFSNSSLAKPYAIWVTQWLLCALA